VVSSSAVDDAKRLLTTIARCPIVERCLSDPSPNHDCRTIVLYQWPDVPVEQRHERWRTEHHLPEPWVGHLESAPLLFVSSNPNLASRRTPGPAAPRAEPLERLGRHDAVAHPSLRRGLSAPKWDWTDDELVDRFTHAFDVFMTEDGSRHVLPSGAADKPVPYWQAMKRLADHLYGRPARPGLDYALTEVVRCKSPQEIGVREAVKTCAPLYLAQTLALSPAAVLCVVGRPARLEFRREFRYPHARQVSEAIDIAGRKRLVTFVAAPNSRAGRAAYPKTVPEGSVSSVRAALAAAAQ
jgi:hypothetical protein